MVNFPAGKKHSLMLAGICSLLCLLAPVHARADLITVLELAGYSSFIHEENFDFPLAAWGIAELNFLSAGNPNVRGEFQLDTLVSSDIVFSVPRAYLKFRFDTLQITVGKTRLAWGEGFFFNAGDVLFDSMSLPALVDLTESELRIATDWLVAGFLALSDFSYVEAVVLPHPQLLRDPDRPLALDIAQLDMGGRAEVNLGHTELEAGYLYKGEGSTSLPYLAFKVRVESWDWYLATSTAIPYATPVWEQIKENWRVSTGLFRLAEIPEGGTVSLRLEAAVIPAGNWQEVSPSPLTLDYGLYLFSDLALVQNNNVSYSLRSLYSPLDGSLLQIWSLNWAVYEDFNLNLFLTLMTGDSDDLFRWGQPGDITLTLSSVFRFGNRS